MFNHFHYFVPKQVIFFVDNVERIILDKLAASERVKSIDPIPSILE